MTFPFGSVGWSAVPVAAALLVTGCGAAQPAGGPRAAAQPQGSVPTASARAAPSTPGTGVPAQPDASAEPSVRVEAVSKDSWWGKPPLKTHLLDVTLQNLASEPRWIAVADTFPHEGTDAPRIGAGEVAELLVFELSRQPRVVLVLTVAAGGVWALRLPARATVTLRRLPVDSWWEHVPAAAELEVVSAREILLGGKPLATCFDVMATSEAGADVTAARDAGDPRGVPERCSPEGDRSAPIEFVDEERLRVRVAL